MHCFLRDGDLSSAVVQAGHDPVSLATGNKPSANSFTVAGAISYQHRIHLGCKVAYARLVLKNVLSNEFK